METALEQDSHSFPPWVTKQISCFCSVNNRCYKFKENTSPICPICKQYEVLETARNQLVCEDATHLKLWEDSVSEIETWLNQYDTKMNITTLVVGYVRGRGQRLVTKISLQHSLL